jgi:hypothetical protein
MDTGKLPQMSVNELQVHLQQILLDDHPLKAEQRFAVKSAIEMFDLVKRIAPGIHSALENLNNVCNEVPVR